jgi:uncharacterized protein (TIGR03000 family)
MRRLLLVSAVLLLPASIAPAQPNRGFPQPPMVGGGFISPPSSAIPGRSVRAVAPPSIPFFLGQRTVPHNGFRAVQARQPFTRGTAGFYPLYPYTSNYYSGLGGFGYGGFGGGFVTNSYYGGYGYGYSPYFVVPGPSDYSYPAEPAAPAQPAFVVELSGHATASLTLEFPAAANVWLDGKEVPGDPATVRTLTSPVLKPGQEYTFHVKAQWEAGGKTYEYTRDVPLGPGKHSKVLVVSGTELKGE